MFQIKNIQQHVTNQLDATVRVLYVHFGGNITITETAEKNDDDRLNKSSDKILLNEVILTNIPTDKKLWIFENEFGQKSHSNSQINNQKNALHDWSWPGR